ncbi:DUF6689 family protein [Gallaecimonas sp. GXIMD4217]|uniref:DUF6689 family protein n=1 Tax=Gallaecimonas sp. GXIMD4217 TaxID=3131927 RepID=UPI00311B33D0
MVRQLSLLACLLSFSCLAAVTESRIARDKAEFTLAEGLHSVELTLSFDRALGLTEHSAGVDAYLFSPTDAALLARLPAGVTPVAAFPMMIVIEPPADQGLAFEGPAEVAIHTHDLDFDAGYRLFKAPLGGDFRDVTANHGAGSYRARGRTGNFSEWLVVRDQRDNDAVVAAKYQRLGAILEGSALPAALLAQLQQLLSLSEQAHELGDTGLALSQLAAFTRLVDAQQGQAIANVWRSSRDLDNLAGRLLGQADTLRFSLLQD